MRWGDYLSASGGRFVALTLLLASLTTAAIAGDTNKILWYVTPAQSWMKEALPLGNGRMGAMFFGGVAKEQLQFNEISLWSGSATLEEIPGLAEAMPRMRQLLAEGKIAEANEAWDSTRPFAAKRKHFGAYQPFGDVHLTFAGHEQAAVQNYRRSLDLTQAVGRVTYRLEDVTYQREYFASFPDQVVVARLTADRPRALTLRVNKICAQSAGKVTVEDGRDLVVTGRMPESGLAYHSRLRVLASGGNISADDTGISVVGADSVILLLAAKTDYAMDWPKHRAKIDLPATVRGQIEAAAKKDYDQLRAAHQADYRALFDRVTLELPTPADRAALPTTQRLIAYHNATAGKDPIGGDPGLEALLFHYGRYLMIASSRQGSLPANLQGVWNNSKKPSWASDYHTDINLQMNYWLCGPAALPECFGPFADYANYLRVPGRVAARKFFHADGAHVSIATNPWGSAEPFPRWIWPSAAGWLAQNMYDHFLFTGDMEYLRHKAYPFMKEASAFMLDLLTPYKGGALAVAPSASPELALKYTDGKDYRLTIGSAHDQQVAYELFSNTIEAAERLAVDKELMAKLKNRLPRLSPPVKVAANGHIQEWIEDWPAANPIHRHASHLYALYPGHLIDPDRTPDHAEAAAKTIVQRSYEKTEWVTAWHMAFWARLHRAENAYGQLPYILVRRSHTAERYPNQSGVYDNLLTTCSPFQIDGNLGTTSGMAEMLLQSHRGSWKTGHELHLLPALPKAWPSGKVTGLRGRGGFEVALEWRDAKLMKATIHSLTGQPIVIRYGTTRKELKMNKGQSVVFDGTEF